MINKLCKNIMWKQKQCEGNTTHIQNYVDIYVIY